MQGSPRLSRDARQSALQPMSDGQPRGSVPISLKAYNAKPLSRRCISNSWNLLRNPNGLHSGAQHEKRDERYPDA